MASRNYTLTEGQTMGPMVLFSGCRAADSDLHAEEKAAAVKEGILDRTFLALSRSAPLPKTYVQDKLVEEAPMIYHMLTFQNGHFYVCGDYRMAEDVVSALKIVFQKVGGLSPKDSEALFAKLKEEKRYHEDIFGIAYRASDIIAKNRSNTEKKSIPTLSLLNNLPMTNIDIGKGKTSGWSKLSEFSFFGCFKRNKREPASLIA